MEIGIRQAVTMKHWYVKKGDVTYVTYVIIRFLGEQYLGIWQLCENLYLKTGLSGKNKKNEKTLKVLSTFFSTYCALSPTVITSNLRIYSTEDRIPYPPRLLP